MTRPGGPSSAERKKADAELKASREVIRYRLNGVVLPDGTTPDWSALTAADTLEKYLYGAGWCSVIPVKPVMAADVVRPETRTYLDASYKKRSETVYPLEGPIWPPRDPS